MPTTSWDIRYPGAPYDNFTLQGTHREALQFAYGETVRPIEICTSDAQGNTLVVETVR
jgi:hypothetical protein